MNTQALQWRGRLPSSTPSRRLPKPFLDALEHIEYGQLTLITPEGRHLEFNGNATGPNAQIKFHDWKAIDALITQGETGFAEAYIKGLWSSPNLPEFLTFGLLNAHPLQKFFYGKPWYVLFTHLEHWVSGNSLRGSRRNIMTHYDLGNDFYSLWLDKSMTYSCALFGNTSRNLEQAQAAKYQRILGKLAAKPGEHVLEIGCGWGGFAEAAAKEGLRVTAITLSKEQADYASARIQNAGLSHLVSIELVDYRKLKGVYDHIVSIGMFEHVGKRYWRNYFNTIRKHLKPGGKAMVQSITLDDELYESLGSHTGFIEQVIFPGGHLPSRSRFCEAATQSGLECYEIFAFGKDYARTTRHWLERFHAREAEVRALGYDDEFMRLWEFYLSACIASFTSGRTDVMQAELGIP